MVHGLVIISILGIIFGIFALIVGIIDYIDDLHHKRRECDWRCEQIRKGANICTDMKELKKQL